MRAGLFPSRWVITCLLSLATMPSPPAAGAADPVDADGVRMLLPPAAGVSFHLGARDPNRTDGFLIEKRTRAEARREAHHEAHDEAHHGGALSFWNVAAHDLEYSSGGDGKTIRLHIYSGREPQRFTWRTQRGFLSTPRDLRNVELTAYLRVHGITDPKRAAISLKIRGGRHTADDPDLASCTMMTFQAASTGAVARFGKELVHPDYDYVRLTPRLPAALVDGRWVALKLVSYPGPGASQVTNRLYVDADPWDAGGRPRNGWQLLAEHVDRQGASTGHYATLVDWGGWVTTVRTDGVESLDFAILSAREVAATPGP